MLEINQSSCFEYALSLCGGNCSALARLAGCTPQAVVQWRKAGVIPIKRVPKLAKALKTTRAKLNPFFARA